jgi:hypothetical protein
LHAADHGGTSGSIRPNVGAGPKVYDILALRGRASERTIELGPPIGLDLCVQIATDYKVASGPELKSGKIGRASAHAVADVGWGNQEVAAVVVLAANDDMDVGVVGIPVIDPHPIESGAEIALGLRHQIPGERLEIREFFGVLRRDDEPEMVAISSAAVGEGAVIGAIVFGVEHAGRRAVLRHTLPSQIRQVQAEH